MSRQTDLEKLIFHEAWDLDGIAILVRMGQDPGEERMRRLNGALTELDEILRGQTILDRRLAYAFWSIVSSVDQNLRSWAREGREWRPELMNEELIELLMNIEYVFEGGLTGEEVETKP